MEPVITDEEVERFCRNAAVPYAGAPSQTHELYKEALAAFLKARVPGQPTEIVIGPLWNAGWNACREAVLNGNSNKEGK